MFVWERADFVVLFLFIIILFKLSFKQLPVLLQISS